MWWFYTVILGMSFGQVLHGLAQGVRSWRIEGDRKIYLPGTLWQIFLLVLIVQVWLAVTYFRETVTEVSILGLVAFLCVPAGIFIMTSLLPGQDGDDDDDSPSYDELFARTRPLFFGVLIAMVLINAVHGIIMGELGLDQDLAFQAAILAGAVVGLFLRRQAADAVLGAAMIVIVGTYIAVGYSSVQVMPGN